jgi:hypothetical protein
VHPPAQRLTMHPTSCNGEDGCSYNRRCVECCCDKGGVINSRGEEFVPLDEEQFIAFRTLRDADIDITCHPPTKASDRASPASSPQLIPPIPMLIVIYHCAASNDAVSSERLRPPRLRMGRHCAGMGSPRDGVRGPEKARSAP